MTPSCSVSSPPSYYWAWEAVNDGSSTWVPATGRRVEYSSWLLSKSGPDLTVAGVLAVNHWIEEISLYLSLPLSPSLSYYLSYK